MTEPAIFQDIDAKLEGYTPGIDRAVRSLTIDDIDALTEFYLRHRRADLPVQDGALGWMAARKAAAGIADKMAASAKARISDKSPSDAEKVWGMFGCAEAIAASIRALPAPTSAQLMAEAMRLPEIAALCALLPSVLVQAMDDNIDVQGERSCSAADDAGYAAQQGEIQKALDLIAAIKDASHE